MSISALESARGVVAEPAAAGPQAAPRGASFAQRLGEIVSEAARAQQDAEHEARELAAGRGGLVETMLALSKADVSLRFVTSLRDRALEAYHEIMRMQV